MQTTMDSPHCPTDMASTGRYSDDDDWNRHRNVVESLAAETGRSFDDIVRRYEVALADLGDGALIKDFLPIFVAKRVKEQCRQEA